MRNSDWDPKYWLHGGGTATRQLQHEELMMVATYLPRPTERFSGMELWLQWGAILRMRCTATLIQSFIEFWAPRCGKSYIPSVTFFDKGTTFPRSSHREVAPASVGKMLSEEILLIDHLLPLRTRFPHIAQINSMPVN